MNAKKAMLSTVAVILIPCALIAGYYIGQQNPLDQNRVSISSQMPLAEAGQVTTESNDSIVDGSSPAPAGATGLIAERLDYTKQWLAKAQKNHYSIQLFMALKSEADNVEEFLRNAPEMLDFSGIYIYETVVNGRLWYSVLYNDFATQDNAIENLEQLPSSLKANDPYLRRVSALKKDSARIKLYAEQAVRSE